MSWLDSMNRNPVPEDTSADDRNVDKKPMDPEVCIAGFEKMKNDKFRSPEDKATLDALIALEKEKIGQKEKSE